MTEIRFYHLTRWPLEVALPKLLEKAMEADMRTVVRLGNEERVAFLNGVLWTYDPASFLPHGTAAEGEAARQPVWLTAGPENPNGARFLVLADGAAAEPLEGYERCAEMFDGRDPDAVAAARARWKAYREAGHSLTYWQQTESGGWTQSGEG